MSTLELDARPKAKAKLPPIARPRTADDPDFDPANTFAEYERYLRIAQELHAKNKLEAAAVYAAVAAHMALRPHAGFYVAPRLERLLADIGRRTAKPTDYRRPAKPEIKHILHVVTELTPVGGLTNMLTRWIKCDTNHTHSLAMTQHRGPVLGHTAEAVINSGGKLHRLNRNIGSQIRWAEELRQLARKHDAVILHVYGQDVVPSIAFAEHDKLPPILLLNHGDHLFWLGASTSDVVINLRDEAQTLSITRRRIDEERNVMVPTIVSPAVRTHSREEAKKLLGIPADTIFMFSAARGMKYRTMNGVTFAEPHVDALKKHKNAQLWVLGSGDMPDWKPFCDAVDGRIKSLPESPDTKLYYEAADIYVDSFPFVSSTSLMEAAGLGTPLVSRFYGPKEARIFAINHPGIDKPTMHGWNEEEYKANLDLLLSDPELRARKGQEALESVLYYHTPPSWLDFIEKAYKLACDLPPIDTAAKFSSADSETFYFGEPDCRLYEIFGYNEDDPMKLLKGYAGMLPTGERLKLWGHLKRAGVMKGWKEALRLTLPDWLVRVLKDRG